VRRFIEIAAGINPPEGLVESVHTQTEGNPLFVTETVRLFIQEGDLTPERLASTDSWTMRAPEGVTQAIGRRLDRLSQRANSVLTTAAVIGRQFTLAQLESIEDEVSEDRLLDVLDEALAARVIEELPDEIGRYQFTHALIQQTLAEELSAARVVRLHARIAEALEQLYVDDIETHVGELAEHFAEADAILGPEKGARYLITAAQQAFEALSFEDARANFERARELAEQLDDKALLAPILEGLGYSTYNTGSISDEYWPLIEQAFNIYVSLGDTKSAVRIGRYPAPAYNTEAQLALYRNALTLAEPESVDAGWILSKIAYTEGNLDRWAESQKSANRAHQIAIHQSNARLAAWSLGRALQPALHAGDLDEALYYYEQSMAHIAAADDVDVETHIYFCGSLIYLILGDGEQARDLSERALESAHKSRSINRIRSALIGQSLVAYAFGSWDKAIQRIEEFEKTPGFELGPIGQAIRMAVESEAGSTEYKDSSFDAVIAASKANVERKRFEPFAGSFILASCLLRNGINTGDERAIDASDELTQSMIEYPPSTASEQGIIAKFKSVRDLMVANTPIDDVNVFQSASRLEFVDWTNGVYWSPMIAQGRIFGLNAKVQGDVDTAAVEFTRAIEECRKAGYKPELAATCVDYAQMLIERGAEADAEKITALQDEAIAITQKLGMKPLMERVLAQREMMKA
jgi:hypothetical protein